MKIALNVSVICICIIVATSCDDSTTQTNGTNKTLKEKREAPQDYIEQLSDQIIESPNNANLYVKRAMAYTERNLMELAVKDAERALSIDSTASYFHQVLGEVNFLKGDLRPARLSLEKAAEIDPANTDALLKLAEVYFLLRRYDEAIIAVNDALRRDDQLAQGYFIKGYIYKETGDTITSISSFQTAVEVNPDLYEAYMELGSLYAFQGDPLALEYFNSALEIRPKSAEAFYHKGMFLQAGSRIDQARETYFEMLRADPNNVLAYYNLGYLYLTEYLAFDTAVAYFDSAVVVRPDYVEAIYNRGLAYEEQELYGEAETSYREALSINPQYDLAARGLSRLLE
ncbi:tetratricopeptide repeat protein [Cryomorphaceae bacterium 1068]|nr:tetratricopeptide repeat protein [Cryomorphaceae bacterium 1068]